MIACEDEKKTLRRRGGKSQKGRTRAASARRALPFLTVSGASLFRRRGCPVDHRAHLADVLIDVADAAQDDDYRLRGEAGFEREGVARENVAAVVGAVEEEVVVAQLEQLAHQPRPVL